MLAVNPLACYGFLFTYLTLSLPTFLAASLILFYSNRGCCIGFSAFQRISGFRFSLILRFFCFFPLISFSIRRFLFPLWFSVSKTYWLSVSAEALTDFPVCKSLISFRTTWLVSFDSGFSFSSYRSMIFLFFSGSYHSFRLFLCIATFP